jgi:hypothetical protein
MPMMKMNAQPMAGRYRTFSKASLSRHNRQTRDHRVAISRAQLRHRRLQSIIDNKPRAIAKSRICNYIRRSSPAEHKTLKGMLPMATEQIKSLQETSISERLWQLWARLSVGPPFGRE